MSKSKTFESTIELANYRNVAIRESADKKKYVYSSDYSKAQNKTLEMIFVERNKWNVLIRVDGNTIINKTLSKYEASRYLIMYA